MAKIDENIKVVMLKGEKGEKGETGEGLPKGGKTGQYLQKKTDADYDFRWSDITTVPWNNVTGKPEATTSSAGLMSAEDKTALDGLKTHSHGLINQKIGINRLDRKPDATWNEIIGDGGDDDNAGNVLKVFATSDQCPEWLLPNMYGTGIAFGSEDMRAVITAPLIIGNPLRVAVCYKNVIKWYADILDSNNYKSIVKSTTKSFTLSAASWSDWTQSISDSLITATSNQEVIPAIGISKEQLTAFQKAMVVDAGQEAGKLTLRVMGTLPTIDIPIRIIFRGTI